MHTKSMVAGGVAGAIVEILAWVSSTFFGVTIPAGVATAVAIIIQAVVHEKFPEVQA